MKIKRYFASDIRQAIRQVREEQGPDAVILSNRTVEGGVEIVAAVDYDESLLLEEAQSSNSPKPPAAAESASTFRDGEPPQIASRSTPRPAASPQSSPSPSGQINRHFYDEVQRNSKKSTAHTSQKTPVEWTQDPALVALKDELRDLRGLVETQLGGLAWGSLAGQHPLHARVTRELMDLGIGAEISRYVAGKLDESQSFDEGWRSALKLIDQNLPTAQDTILDQGGVVALVGPTGVGKTTTIAKLAARYTLRHGPGRVALITTDNYRIGALEQLRTFGHILGAPVYVAKDFNELEQTINSLHDKDLVLIDTAGMSPRDVRLSEQLALLGETLREVNTYLVLSATTQIYGLDEAVRAFRSVGLQGCILTKLDETVSLGEVLSTVIKYSLSIAYVSDGQQVPEDLHPARSHNLVDRCVTLAREHKQTVPDEAVELSFGRMVVNASV